VTFRHITVHVQTRFLSKIITFILIIINYRFSAPATTRTMTHYTVQFTSAIPGLATVDSREQKRVTLEDWRGMHQLRFCWQQVPCSGGGDNSWRWCFMRCPPFYVRTAIFLNQSQNWSGWHFFRKIEKTGWVGEFKQRWSGKVGEKAESVDKVVWFVLSEKIGSFLDYNAIIFPPSRELVCGKKFVCFHYLNANKLPGKVG